MLRFVNTVKKNIIMQRILPNVFKRTFFTKESDANLIANLDTVDPRHRALVEESDIGFYLHYGNQENGYAYFSADTKYIAIKRDNYPGSFHHEMAHAASFVNLAEIHGPETAVKKFKEPHTLILEEVHALYTQNIASGKGKEESCKKATALIKNYAKEYRLDRNDLTKALSALSNGIDEQYYRDRYIEDGVFDEIRHLFSEKIPPQPVHGNR